jgi:hypothetical protein
MNELVRSLRDVRKLLELGEQVDHEFLGQILDAIPSHAPRLSKAELQQLAQEVASVMELVKEQQADIVERLDDIHHGRSGIDGYNHLKAFHKAQRLSKRV